MALLFSDMSVCSLCGQILRDGDAIYGFPAFGENPQDPLHRFSDAAFHEACLLADREGRQAVALIEDRALRIGPGNRKCAVCGEEILDWNDYGMIDYICSPGLHPVSSFNYTHFHKSHSTVWPRKDELIRELSSAWKAGIISLGTAKGILDHIGLTVPADWETGSLWTSKKNDDRQLPSRDQPGGNGASGQRGAVSRAGDGAG